MRVIRIVPDLPADEPAAGAEFYAQVLGLELAMNHGWIATFVAPDNPAAQISLMLRTRPRPYAWTCRLK
jgi:hypothetical protein